MAKNIWSALRHLISPGLPGNDFKSSTGDPNSEAGRAAQNIMGMMGGLTGQNTSLLFGAAGPESLDPLDFDAMDELEKAMAQYSYSASRHAYAPFFSQGGAGGQRTHTGYTGPQPTRDGSAPTPGSSPSNPGFRTPGAHRGMVQALGASQRRNARPGTLAPRTY